MKKRILSVLFVFIMCAGVLLIQAFAAEPNTTDSMESAMVTESVELPSIETSAQMISLLSLDDTGKVALKSTSEDEWFDRLDLTDADYATTFYQWLETNSTKGGLLMDPTKAELLNDGSTYVYMATTFTGKSNYSYTAGNSSANGAAAYAAISNQVNANFNAASAYLHTVYAAFDRDHPEVFWLAGNSRVLHSTSYSYGSDGVVTFTQNVYFILKNNDFDIRAAKYRDPDTLTAAYDTYYDTVSQAVNTIWVTKLNNPTTVASSTLVETIHDYLTEINCYNTSSDLYNIDHDCREFISALDSGYIGANGPVCEGYARAFKVLCDKFDVPCILTEGIANNGTSSAAHMWNYVQLEDGNWYAVDVTWDDPTISGISSPLSGYEIHDYLLVGSETEINAIPFIESHPVSNLPSALTPAFINGPTLSAVDYATAKAASSTTQAVSNVHFELTEHVSSVYLPHLHWTEPTSSVDGSRTYRITVSSDFGSTWSKESCTTSQNYTTIHHFSVGNYNSIKVETLADDVVIAEVILPITLTISQGTTLPSANFIPSELDDSSAFFTLTFAGLTPNTDFFYKFYSSTPSLSSFSHSDENGIGTLNMINTFWEKYCADSTTTYLIQEISDVFINATGTFATITFTNRGERAYLSDLLKPDAPSSTVTVNATSGKPVISWTAVENATGYEVWVSNTKTGTYTKLITTDSDKLSITHTGAKVGNTYFYQVKTVTNNATSDPSTAKGVWCDLPAPTITVANRASDGKPTITWTAVEGATGYEVYRCGTKTGTYTKLYTASATKLSVTHTGAAVGNDYFYKVKAIYGGNSSCDSAFSSAKGVWVDLKTPTIKVVNSVSSGKPVISWSKVDYAVNYKVYCAVGSSTAEYKLIYTTPNANKLSVTHIGAKAGEAYFYKVVAVHKNSKCTSAYSTAKGVYCDLARPTLTVELNSKGNPYLSWTEVDGADGYKVYRSTDGKTWTRMYVADANDFDVNHTGAKVDTTYYYKVFAVCNATSKGNSAYSTVQSITAK